MTACDSVPRSQKGVDLRKVSRADFNVVTAVGQVDANGLSARLHGGLPSTENTRSEVALVV